MINTAPGARVVLACFSCLVSLATSSTAQRLQQDPVITVEGQPFYTWQEYTSSDLFQRLGLRCNTQLTDSDVPMPPSDCSMTNTTIKTIYNPTFRYEIPVVVHVIQSTTGAGQISNAMIQSQIDVLNEDFLAIPGTNGAPGTNSQVRFFLAQVDPNGNATTGITRTTNNTWFNDQGNYWTPLHWDTNRYLNFYTNLASGYLGYVSGFPAQGIAGMASDRIVCLWSAFGRNAPIGPPYNLGRTATHEAGHYFGLFHTFQGSCCPTAFCYTTCDLICDTNPESGPNFGCPGSRTTCGSLDPIHNYMDYSDDICYNNFTVEQVNRMRCSVQHWRTLLPCAEAKVTHRNAGPNLDIYTASTPGLGLTLNLTVNDSGSTGYTMVVYFGHLLPASVTLPGGQVLLVDLNSPRVYNLALPKTIPTVLSFPIPNDPALCGLTLSTQAGLVLGVPGFVLSNAQDLVVGR